MNSHVRLTPHTHWEMIIMHFNSLPAPAPFLTSAPCPLHPPCVRPTSAPLICQRNWDWFISVELMDNSGLWQLGSHFYSFDHHSADRNGGDCIVNWGDLGTGEHCWLQTNSFLRWFLLAFFFLYWTVDTRARQVTHGHMRYYMQQRYQAGSGDTTQTVCVVPNTPLPGDPWTPTLAKLIWKRKQRQTIHL